MNSVRIIQKSFETRVSFRLYECYKSTNDSDWMNHSALCFSWKFNVWVKISRKVHFLLQLKLNRAVEWISEYVLSEIQPTMCACQRTKTGFFFNVGYVFEPLDEFSLNSFVFDFACVSEKFLNVRMRWFLLLAFVAVAVAVTLVRCCMFAFCHRSCYGLG